MARKAPGKRWTKVREDLPEDPRVEVMARRLKLPLNTVLGALIRVWIWANKVTRDGVTKFADRRTVDARAEISGFAEAMEGVGWLEVSAESLTFPRWHEHNWVDAEVDRQKQLAAERQARFRDKQRPVTLLVTPSNASTTTLRNGVTLPNLTIPEKNPPNPPAGGSLNAANLPLPLSLDTPEFREAWTGWCRYRESKRKKLGEDTANAQLKRLAKWGLAAALRSIEESITQGWVGLFEADGKTKKRAGPKLEFGEAFDAELAKLEDRLEDRK